MSEMFEGFPLSPQQERLWQVHGHWGLVSFRAEIVARIQGNLDLRRLEGALGQVVSRHEILRTTFRRLPGMTLPVQVIGGEGEAAPVWTFADLMGFEAGEREARFENTLTSWRSDATDADVSEGPPLRVLLARMEDAEYRLALALPALCADSVAMENLLTEIFEAYAGTGTEQEVLQYADLSEWLRELLDSDEGRGFTLPVDRSGDFHASLPFEEGPAGRSGIGSVPLPLTPALTEALDRFATEMAVSLEDLLLAVWRIALFRLTGRPLVVGVHCDGRRYEGLDAVVGLLAKTLPVSPETRPASTVREWAIASQEAVEDARSWHEYFSWSLLPGDPSASFGFHRLAGDRRAGGLEIVTLRVRTVYDESLLRLCCAHAPGRLEAEIQYDASRHGRSGILRLARVFVRLLEQVVSGGDARVGDLDLLTAEERHRLAWELNDTAREGGRLCVHRQFERRARLSPESVALASGDRRLTYGELDARANALARRLRAMGVGPDTIVGLFLHRSFDMVAAVLGVLKAGGAYLPLDPAYPEERLAFMRDDARLSALVTCGELVPKLPMEDPSRVLLLDSGWEAEASAEDLPDGSSDLDHLAYVIYTSGSTGRPKGAMIHHRGLANYLDWCLDAYRADEGTGSLLHSSLGFDLTVTSLFPALLAGRTVFLAPVGESGGDLSGSLRPLADLSLVKITPAHLAILSETLNAGEAVARTRAFVIGGEALRWESLPFWRTHAPHTRLLNEYGPTETVVGCCVYEVGAEDPAEGAVPIGRPVFNTRLYVLDAAFRPVPAGVAGELYIGGAGVARGYLGRPALTAERFIPDGLSGAPGERLYRTGDLVRHRSDGQLEFLGRTDTQVKLRGFRIELGEIEASLAGHPAIKEAVVMLRPDATGSERLVAYATARCEPPPAPEELRAFLARTLPEHMLPSAFEFLAAWPLTVHGKVDRSALPEPSAPRMERSGEPVVPGNFLEEVLAGIWAEILHVEEIGVHDNFFQLGGDSILSIEVVARCRQRGLALSPQVLFQNPTVRALAQKVVVDGAPGEGFQPSEPFSLVVEEERESLPEDAEDAYPLTRLQAGMLFHSLYSPETAVYHEILTFHLRAPLETGTLAAVLENLIARHPALRTSLHVVGYAEPLQIVHRKGELRFEVMDLAAATAEEEEEALAAWIREERRRGFEWSRPSLIRFFVHRRAGDTFQFSLSYHHSIVDGWSVATLLTELFVLYTAALRRDAPPALPSSQACFRDFVAAERRAIESPGYRQFWSEHLAGVEPLILPRERKPGAVRPVVEIRKRHVPISAAAAAGVAYCARAEGVPVKSVLLSVYLKVLSVLGERTDVTAGLVVHARPQALAAERIVGLFLNTLPLRLQVPAGSWRDLVRAAFEAELKTFPHRVFPLAEIQRTVRLEPLFETVFNFVHFHVYQAVSGVTGLEVLGGTTFEETNFPLSVVCLLDPGLAEPHLRLEYDALELSDHEIERIAGYFESALAALAQDPSGRHDQALLLSPEERHQALVEWNDTASAHLARRPFPEIFAEQARTTPEATALLFGREILSYRELDDRAERLAHNLRRLGVGPDTIVGLCVERGVNLIVGLLGILKAGGAYLPLDPSYPQDRLAFMLEDSGTPLLLTEPAVEGGLPEHGARVARIGELMQEGLESRPEGFAPESLAYVIYTSGSTGRPKGVGVTHRGLSNLVAAQHEVFGVLPPDRLLQFSSASFDASVFEIVMALGAGATLVLGPRENMIPGPALAALIERHRVTHVTMPPSILAALDPASVPSLRLINVAGEACPAALVDRWAPGRRFLNLYGPTETTVWASIEPCFQGTGTPPIGRPVANVYLHLLGRDRFPVPVGVPAELCIGGEGLARGYLNRPDLTAERFIPDPWSASPGARLYRTGDLVRRLPDGRIDFLGRVDRQVKIRGFRIELGEIEAVLRRFPGVSDGIVLARQSGTEDARLVAYLVTGDAEIPVGKLRDFLRQRLPDSMIPGAFVALETMPLTPSGKVDHAALPDPTGDRPHLREAYAPPRNAVERAVAEVWQEILQLDRVGREDNFFDLGGHSLLVLRMQARLREALGADLPIVDLFTYPTVRALAEHVLRLRGGEVAGPADGAETASAGASDPSIAIIGMSGRFPGAGSVEELWWLLSEGREAISFFSAQELRDAGIEEELLEDPRYVRAKGVLEGADLFDASFFGFTPREAEVLDPQQRVFLECVWEALENAGHGRPAGRRIGVFAGSSMNTYWFNILSNPEAVEAVGSFQTITSNDKDFLATRVSYKLGLTGPSLTVQTACSTSLVAVHVACQALRAGECDMAVAGGVSVRLPQTSGYPHLEGGIDSPDGHCRAFDAAAEGTVAGNGVGVIVLKRFADALADGDPIRAVVKGSATNNDGSSKVGFTAPSVEGQAQVIRAAQRMAGIEPRAISYVEAHGTGTPLGDPIEIAALKRAFGGGSAEGGCALGSVKTNLGHLDAAAGVAGLIKTVLQIEHRTLVPSLHFERPNPQLQIEGSPFSVNTGLRAWEGTAGPLRAGVSSFGIGGTNAHVVLEEPPPLESQNEADSRQLIVLSARSEAALDRMTSNLADHLDRHPSLRLADAAYTLQVGRSEFPWRRALVAGSLEGARRSLTSLEPGRVVSSFAEGSTPAVAFLFSGQGAQYPGMVSGLYREVPRFRHWLDLCAELLKKEAGLELLRLLEAETIHQTSQAQPALFAVEYSLARLWMELGITPQALLGHSIGELVAACLAGVFSLEDGISLVAARGRLVQELPPGAMLAVALSETEASAFLRDGLSLAAVNAPDSVVVSGEAEPIARLEEELRAANVELRRLRTSHAFHSGMMEPALAALAERVAQVALRPPEIPFLSNVTGTWITAEQATDPSYWATHLRATVRFSASVEELAKEPDRLFLEVGPGQSLANLVRRHPSRRPEQPVLTSVRHASEPAADQEFLLNTLGRLWLAGQPVSWEALPMGERRRRVALPAYPFERRRFWIEARPDASIGTAPARRGMADWFYEPSWQRSGALFPREAGPDEGVWWVLADQGPVGRDLARTLERTGRRAVTVLRSGEYVRLGPRELAIDPGQPGHYQRLLDDLGELPGDIIHCWGLDEEAEEADPALGCLSLIHLAQAVLGRFGSEPLRLRVVTRGAFEVMEGESVRPGAAMLLGPCLVMPQEHPGLQCRLVDVVPPSGGAPSGRWLDRLVAEVTAEEPGQEVVALRGGYRWHRTYEPVRWPAGSASPEPPLRRGGVYLITGGLGRVGLALAEHLASRWEARLVLVGRSALRSRPARLEALLASGAEVELVAANAADRAQMAAALDRAVQRFGALHGVIHAAGEIGHQTFRSVQETGREDLERQLRAKVQGGLVLAELLADRALDFCILISSLSSVLGGLGFASYSAANCFLDALAHRQSHLGPARWLSLDWDAWSFPEESGAESLGISLGITPAKGAEAFERALSLPGARQIVISVTDLEARLERSRAAAAQISSGQELQEEPDDTRRHPRPGLSTAYVAPRNGIERRLAALWESLLGVGQVGVEDNFFELGGHSLLATQMLAKIRETFRVHLPFEELFALPRIAALAERLAALQEQGERPAVPPLQPAPRSGPLPLSFSQQRLWFFQRLEPESPAYNVFAAFRLHGALDLFVLERALREVVRRHEVLRTRFTEVDGVPLQEILAEAGTRLPIVDLTGLPPEAWDGEARARFQQVAQHPFDLAKGPLFRALVARLSATEHLMLVAMHHIVCDAWSVGVFNRELTLLYTAFSAGQGSPLPALPVQYADYALWQRRWLEGGVLEAQLAYWRRKLAGLTPAELPTDRPRPPRQTFQGATLPFELPSGLSSSLRALCQRENVTLFMLLLAGFQVLLSRYTGQTDLALGTNVTHRASSAVEGLIGFFVNNLVLRCEVVEDLSFREHLRRVRESALEAYAHQDLPFERLVEELQRDRVRDPSRHPLFQILFVLQNTPGRDLSLPGVSMQPFEVTNQTAAFDLLVNLYEGEESLCGAVEYNTDLFEPSTIARLCEYFEAVLEQIAADPDQEIDSITLSVSTVGANMADDFNMGFEAEV